MHLSPSWWDCFQRFKDLIEKFLLEAFDPPFKTLYLRHSIFWVRVYDSTLWHRSLFSLRRKIEMSLNSSWMFCNWNRPALLETCRLIMKTPSIAIIALMPIHTDTTILDELYTSVESIQQRIADPMAMKVPNVPPPCTIVLPTLESSSRPLIPYRKAVKPPNRKPDVIPTQKPMANPSFVLSQQEGPCWPKLWLWIGILFTS